MARRTPTATTAPAFTPRIRRLGDHRYLVESKTTRGVGHQVDTRWGTCTCPAGKHGRPTCWHRTLAATFDAAYQAWMAQAAGVTPATTRRPVGMAALQDAYSA